MHKLKAQQHRKAQRMTIYIKSDYLLTLPCAEDNLITQEEAKALVKQLKNESSPQVREACAALKQLLKEKAWDHGDVRLYQAAARLCSSMIPTGGMDVVSCEDGSPHQLFGRHNGSIAECAYALPTGGTDYSIYTLPDPSDPSSIGEQEVLPRPDLKRSDYHVFTDGAYRFCFVPEDGAVLDGLMVSAD